VKETVILVFSSFLMVVVLVAAFMSYAQAQNPSQTGRQETTDDVVRVNTTLVTVPVGVKDRHGKSILNLRREDFRLYEDGVEHEIAYFESPEKEANSEAAGKPLTVALLLDLSDSTQFKLDKIQEAAIAFINQLRADDRVLVIAFDKRVQVLTEVTNDREVLRQAIGRTRTGGGTSLYNAVETVINHRLDRISGRKAIVLLTDGVDTTSVGATYVGTVRAAEQLDAAIYPVQYHTYGDFADNPSRETYTLGNFGGTAHVTKNGELASEAYKRATLYLRLLAETTGGRFQYADNLKNLGRSFARIASELRQQYSLGYYPKSKVAADGTEIQIKVEVRLPKVTVRARKSYVYKPATGTLKKR
jgi:VWFA-related protein